MVIPETNWADRFREALVNQPIEFITPNTHVRSDINFRQEQEDQLLEKEINDPYAIQKDEINGPFDTKEDEVKNNEVEKNENKKEEEKEKGDDQ